MTGKPFDIRTLLEQSEVEQIYALNENPILVQALRKVILMPIYYNGTIPRGQAAPNPMLNWVMGFLASDPKATDEQIGKEVKLRGAATELVAYAFGEIEKIRRPVESSPKETDSR